jgi:hypothetical protein
MASPSTSFTVLSYNILARSLGSVCIPWVLKISPPLEKAVLDTTGAPFRDWIKTVALPAYKCHFHKNYASGDKDTMRQLWSAAIESAADIPESLLAVVNFISADTVSYTTEGQSSPVVATTFRGLLKRHLPPTLGNDIYEQLMETERHFMWPNRGPRIFRTINACADVLPAGGCSMADIVTLYEYDCHDVSSRYDGESCVPFWAAMQAKGYTGIFFKGPHLVHGDNSGKGVFWNHNTFALAGGSVPTDDGLGLECPPPLVVTTETPIPGASNHDLHEHWSPLSPSPPAAAAAAAAAGDVGLVEMAACDRKAAALLHLRHLASGRLLLLVAVHMMTESRDNSAACAFPGEVRAGELASIRHLVERELRRAREGRQQPIHVHTCGPWVCLYVSICIHVCPYVCVC